eukprot:11141863-Heterocapsa_arctica.AAC.1
MPSATFLTRLALAACCARVCLERLDFQCKFILPALDLNACFDLCKCLLRPPPRAPTKHNIFKLKSPPRQYQTWKLAESASAAF